jgi:hypothetical protein
MNLQNLPLKNKLQFFAKVIFSCLIYSAICSAILEMAYVPTMTLTKNVMRAITMYSVIFIIPGLIPIIIGISKARANISTNAKLGYLNRGLLWAWIVSFLTLAFLGFGQYYPKIHLKQEAQDVVEKFPSTINKEVGFALQRMAYCSNVLGYAANYYLLLKNEEAARVILLHHAKAYAALIYVNFNSAVDAQQAIALEKSVAHQVINELDQDLSVISELSDKCVSDTNRFIDEFNLYDKSPDGINFQDFVSQLARENFKQFGLM